MEACQKAFEALKQALISGSILQLPKEGERYTLHTDTSGVMHFTHRLIPCLHYAI